MPESCSSVKPQRMHQSRLRPVFGRCRKGHRTFEPRGDDATLVRIATRGFRGDGGELLAQAVDAKGGYTMVLAGLKAWLEHGIELGLVHDQFPDGCPG